jgi:hypothetical protein
MTTERERTLTELTRRTPFWACFIVFLLLACNHGFGLLNLIEQRQQLDRTRLLQAQNRNTLLEAERLEARLQALSLDLLQVASSNLSAKQIVKEFNIQWHPGPASASVAPAPNPEK